MTVSSRLPLRPLLPPLKVEKVYCAGCGKDITDLVTTHNSHHTDYYCNNKCKDKKETRLLEEARRVLGY